MSVNVVKNFISLKDAKFIVSNFDKNLSKIEDRPGFYEDLHKRSPQSFDLNKLDFDNFFSNHNSRVASSMINHFIYITKMHLESFYNLSFNNFVGGMTKLTAGADQGLHADMYNLDGTEIEGDEDAKKLKYSALLYLSSIGIDFDGGVLEFPNQNISIEPKSGTLVFFEGNHEHPHRVTEILSGNRYAIVMFFG